MHKTLVRSIVLLPILPVYLTSCGASKQTTSIRTPAFYLDSQSDNDVLDYQIGHSWDKTEVTPELLRHSSDVLKKAAMATAKLTVMFSTGTGFVIGENKGRVMLATNHHVIENQRFCDETRVVFENLNIRGLRCDAVIITDTELDLTLFTIKGADETVTKKLLSVALQPSKSAPTKGQNLLTIGYGFAGNPRDALMVDQQNDCKVFSRDGELRYMPDPDVVNPGPHKTWVFAAGCDVSHGDSGSALVDRQSGQVIGILSTGKIPKISKVREADYLQEIYDNNSEDIWSELTYVVPFSKIFEKLGNSVFNHI